MRKVVVTVTREHLERAVEMRQRYYADKHGTPACRWCVVAQAMTDAGLINVECGIYSFYTGLFAHEYPHIARRLVDLFDDDRDSEILALLPVTFEVEVQS